VLSIGYLVSAGFEQIYIMYNISVYSTGDILETTHSGLAWDKATTAWRRLWACSKALSVSPWYLSPTGLPGYPARRAVLEKAEPWLSPLNLSEKMWFRNNLKAQFNFLGDVYLSRPGAVVLATAYPFFYVFSLSVMPYKIICSSSPFRSSGFTLAYYQQILA